MSSPTTDTLPGLFEIEQVEDTIIASPTANLSELDHPQVESGAEEVLAALRGPSARHLVVDLFRTNYFGSTALGVFTRFLSAVRRRQGRLAMCNLSKFEREILEVTRMDHLWPLCASREEALAAVQN